MKRPIRNTSLVLLPSLFMLFFASCKSETKNARGQEKSTETVASEGNGQTTFAFTPGQAGGMIEETFSVSVTVSAIDASSRQITLKANDGSMTTFTAGPDVRNFDQIRVGDKVNATILEQLLISVHNDNSDPKVIYAAALARAPKGAKPGMMVGQSYAIVATVRSIDPDGRTSVLQFSDGQTRTFPIRSDVDLSKYNAGDTVVIQVNQSLSIVVEKP